MTAWREIDRSDCSDGSGDHPILYARETGDRVEFTDDGYTLAVLRQRRYRPAPDLMAEIRRLVEAEDARLVDGEIMMARPKTDMTAEHEFAGLLARVSRLVEDYDIRS